MSLILMCFVFFLIIFIFFKWRFNYWKRHGIQQLEPIIPFGDMKKLLLQQYSIGQQYNELYKIIKSKKLKFAGTYLSFKPILVVADPELTKTMLIKDFSHFVNHGYFLDTKKDPLSGHLFNLENNEWRTLRQKLTPTFTSGKIKMMFDTMNNCATSLSAIMEDFAKNREAIDIKEVMACFATDVIASIAFGVECNSLKNPECDFRHYGRRVFQTSFLDNLKLASILVLPKSILKYTPIKDTKQDVEDFFMKIIHKMLHLREDENNYRKDFLQLLVQLKNQDNLKLGEESAFTLNEIAAQAYVFFFAGFETVAATINFLLFELALNQDIQDKLRDEIKTVLKKYDNKICHEALNEMNYMDNVVYETMRKHPPIEILFRTCNKTYKIPNTDSVIEEGRLIYFAIGGMQNDPTYYPEPEKFMPERFTNEDKNNRPWMPFGEGPRICIGMRFAIAEVKIAVTNILKDFRMKINSKTRLPLRFAPGTFVKTSIDPIWLDIEKI